MLLSLRERERESFIIRPPVRNNMSEQYVDWNSLGLIDGLIYFVLPLYKALKAKIFRDGELKKSRLIASSNAQRSD